MFLRIFSLLTEGVSFAPHLVWKDEGPLERTLENILDAASPHKIKRAGVRRTFLFLLYPGPVVAQTAPVAQSVKRFAAQLQLSFRSEKFAFACLSPDRRCNIARTWGTPLICFLSHPLIQSLLPVHTRGRLSSFQVFSSAPHCSFSQII